MKQLFSLLFLCSFFSFAQVVNVENQRLGDQEGWSGYDDFNFNFTRNTKDIYQLNNKLRVQYAKERHLFFILSQLDFVKAGDDDFLNHGYEHMRYNFTLDTHKQHFVLEAFRQSQFNRIQLIRLRSLYGAGIRVNAIQKDSLMLIFGVTPMAEFELLTDNTENKAVRLSNYLAVDYQMNETFGINAIIYYQPSMSWIRDQRTSIETGIRLKINSHLNYIMSYSMIYDEFPPEGIPRNNWNIKNGLRFKF